MCGRYSLTTPVEALRRLFGFEGPAPNLQPRWNIAPTQSAPVIRLGGGGGREIKMLSWGLVPYWAEDAKLQSHMINARGETVAEKPAFKQAFRQRRCLVPADGFYEWQTLGPKTKQPLLFKTADGAPFAFAGLWERWVPPQGEVLETFTIVNTAANEMMAQFHDRVPIVLSPADYAAWLDPAVNARALIKAPPSDWLTFRRVSTYVNSVKHDDPGCQEPAPDAEPAPEAPKAKAKKAVDGRQGSLF
ncbi:MAG: SOS response-associated peptidase [Azospirillum sp.]|nr:SOS response-associated peptidase [Azospirillum sp.]MCA3265022.1 SOS response-associated peptidase [Azospirillum sp.]